MIDCAVAFRNQGDFYRNVYVTLLSCFENTRESLRVHLVTGEPDAPWMRHFHELCERYRHDLRVYAAPPIPRDILDLFPNHVVGGYTEASLYRLYLHEFIPADRLLYLDCDLVFERDIADLHGQDTGGACLAAVHDPARVWSLHKKSYYLKKMGILEEKYFNSGVLVLNLKKIREKSQSGNIFWKYYHTLRAELPKLPFVVYDQDLLNALFSRHTEELVLLDPSFNYEVCLFDRRFLPPEKLRGKILHFAALKPWAKFFPVHLHYWKYHALSPWKEETFERMSRRFFDPRDRRTSMLMNIWRRPRLVSCLGGIAGALPRRPGRQEKPHSF
jgi:lipopolysaccharide biosynthesis glycosyltransferase